jgi:hypothetical protein
MAAPAAVVLSGIPSIPKGARFAFCSSADAGDANLRIKITQPLLGSIDRIQLGQFVPGCVYVVGTSLGNYLLAMGAAEPVSDESPALLTPLQQMARPPATLKRGGAFAALLDRAADRPPRKKRIRP